MPEEIPFTISLASPVMVQEITVQTSEVFAPELESLIFDRKNKEIGLKFTGVEARTVIKGEAYDAIYSILAVPFKAAIEAALNPE